MPVQLETEWTNVPPSVQYNAPERMAGVVCCQMIQSGQGSLPNWRGRGHQVGSTRFRFPPTPAPCGAIAVGVVVFVSIQAPGRVADILGEVKADRAKILSHFQRLARCALLRAHHAAAGGKGMEVIARIGRIIGADFQRVHVQKFLAVRIGIRTRSPHGLGKPGAGVGGLRRYRRHRRAQRAVINSHRPINLRRHRRFQRRFGSDQRRQPGSELRRLGRVGSGGRDALRGAGLGRTPLGQATRSA